MNRTGAALAGRKVLLTRPALGGTDLVSGLVDAGCIVEHRPTVRLEPPADLSEADRAVRQLRTFDWIIFTSPAAVRFLFSRIREGGGAGMPESIRVAVVGPGTAAELDSRGVRADLTAAGSGAGELAERLAGILPAGARVLWARAEGASPVLGERLAVCGASLADPVFYRTVADPDCGAIAAAVVEGRWHGILFTSPSGFRALLEAVPGPGLDRFRQVAKVAIGAVTATAMERAGYPPCGVASTPDAAGVLDAFARAFGPEPLC